MCLRSLGAEFNILAWYHLKNFSICQAGINCASLPLLKQLVCATRYAIKVGTRPTKSVTCNGFSFEVKSLFIFRWAPPFSSTAFASIWAGIGPCPKKRLSCFWRQEGLEERLEPLLWLTAVWLIRFKARIAVSWAWSSSPNNKVVTGVWEEHKEPYSLSWARSPLVDGTRAHNLYVPTAR